jgi:hypothetical protein
VDSAIDKAVSSLSRNNRQFAVGAILDNFLAFSA